jgi:hypothetical protein
MKLEDVKVGQWVKIVGWPCTGEVGQVDEVVSGSHAWVRFPRKRDRRWYHSYELVLDTNNNRCPQCGEEH